jgi:formamidopyrimidine-DNA glycosylase
MPELPEVETIVQELSKKIKGKKIINIKIINPKLRYPIPQQILDFTYNILSVTRTAKFIVISLDMDHQIIIHLGMTGKILINHQPSSVQHKHDHLLIQLNDNISITYNDTRKFGFITTPELAPKSFFNSASDPLEESFSPEKLKHILKHSRKPIKTCLMDNNIITGVGNIYASESLFKAKILPTRQALSLTTSEIDLLIKEIKNTLLEAIKAGGSSIKDYRNSSGNLGYFQQQLFVYNRANKPCKICSEPIQRLVISGRSTFFCSNCQK